MLGALGTRLQRHHGFWQLVEHHRTREYFRWAIDLRTSLYSLDIKDKNSNNQTAQGNNNSNLSMIVFADHSWRFQHRCVHSGRDGQLGKSWLCLQGQTWWVAIRITPHCGMKFCYRLNLASFPGSPQPVCEWNAMDWKGVVGVWDHHIFYHVR